MPVNAEDVQSVLKDLKLGTKATNERSAYVAMVCCGLSESDNWTDAVSKSLGINEMIKAINRGFPKANKGNGYKPNTRETIRDDTVKAFRAHGLLELENPNIPANSKNVRYRSTDVLISLLQSIGTANYDIELARANAVSARMISIFDNKRQLNQTPVVLPDKVVSFISNRGQGPLVKAIIENMLPRFAGGADVLSIDTADGLKFPWDGHNAESKAAKKVKELILEQPKTAGNTPVYPDVIAYDRKKDWLFLVEACNSEGVFDEMRRSKLSELFKPFFPNLLFITCFNSRDEMKQWMAQLAWETEVWVMDNPEHMIHLDGLKYLSPYPED